MDILLLVLKFVIGPIVSIILTLAISEPLKNALAPFVSYFGSRAEEGVKGRWMATFYYGENETPCNETIEITMLFGSVVGYGISHPDIPDNGKKSKKCRPLRLRGNIKDNRFFTGIWFHPNRISHHHGAFELLINLNNADMNGVWLGYNEAKHVVESGKWEWKRLNE